MIDYFNEILAAYHAGLYRVALSSALTLPDVCSMLYPNAIDGTDSGKVGERYQNWYNKYAKENCIIDAVICYKYRCSMIHTLRSTLQNAEETRMAFYMPGTSPCIFSDCNVEISYSESDGRIIKAKAKLIDLQTFISGMVQSAIDWYNIVKDKPEFRNNYEYFVQPRPESPLCMMTGGLITY